MDVLDGYGIYSKLFVFRETDPLNDLFEMLDYSDKNFVLNSGSYFVMMVLLLAYYIVGYIINRLAVCFVKVKCCRKIGMAVKEDSYIFAFW